MFLWFNKKTARANLRRKLREDRLASLVEKQKAIEEKQRLDRITELRSVAQLAIADVLNMFAHHHFTAIKLSQEIHSRVDNIIALSNSNAFFAIGDYNKLIRQLFWISTVVPENKNGIVKDAIKAMIDFKKCYWHS